MGLPHSLKLERELRDMVRKRPSKPKPKTKQKGKPKGGR